MWRTDIAQYFRFFNFLLSVYSNSADFDALVVKASGLAAGKGVVVASTKVEACDAVKEIMDDKIFGKAGDVVIVEELLQGPEVSVSSYLK